MTDEQRKALTLYLGEPWTLSYNMRSFTTDADMMALFRKTVDNGKWFSCENSFWDYAFFVWRADRDNDQRDYSAWLFYDPARFCCLVAQWLEERK
jgi:hypothetical protein